MRVNRCRAIICAIGVFCLFSLTPALAGIVYTDKIDMVFLGFDYWYDFVSLGPPLDGSINFDNTSISNSQSFLSTFDNIGSDNILTISGGFTFTSDIISDYSSGQYARGLFAGGSTISFVGTISQNGTYLYGDDVNDLPIFQATLRSVHDSGWSLEEDTQAAGSFNRTLEIELSTSVGLGSGITFEYGGTDYTLKLGATSEYPKMKLELKSMLPVSNFKSNDLYSGGTASHVKITSVTPEPATLMLVGLGAVLLRTRRRGSLTKI